MKYPEPSNPEKKNYPKPFRVDPSPKQSIVGNVSVNGNFSINGNVVSVNNGAGNVLTTVTEFDTTTWSYNPKIPSHWTSGAPLSISEALDKIAANISAGIPL